MKICYEEKGEVKNVMSKEEYEKCISNYVFELADTGLETCKVLEELYDSIVKAYSKHLKYNAEDCERISVIYDDIQKLKTDLLIISF